MTTTTRYALCTDVTPTRATIAIITADRDDLVMTRRELSAAGHPGLDDTAVIVRIDDDSESVGDRIVVEGRRHRYSRGVVVDLVAALADLDDGSGNLGVAIREALSHDVDATAHDVRATWVEATEYSAAETES